MGICGVVCLAVSISGGLGVSPESVSIRQSAETSDIMVAIGAVVFALSSLMLFVGVYLYRRYLRESGSQKYNDVPNFSDGRESPEFDVPDANRGSGTDRTRQSHYSASHQAIQMMLRKGTHRHVIFYLLLAGNCMGTNLLLFGTMPWHGHAVSQYQKDDGNYWQFHGKYDFSALDFNMKAPSKLNAAYTANVVLVWGVEKTVAIESSGGMQRMQRLGVLLSSHGHSPFMPGGNCDTNELTLPVFNSKSVDGFDPSIPAVQEAGRQLCSYLVGQCPLVYHSNSGIYLSKRYCFF